VNPLKKEEWARPVIENGSSKIIIRNYFCLPLYKRVKRVYNNIEEINREVLCNGRWYWFISSFQYRRVEQRKLAGFITRRSRVRVPLCNHAGNPDDEQTFAILDNGKGREKAHHFRSASIKIKEV
jgi:hypothetical protein